MTVDQALHEASAVSAAREVYGEAERTLLFLAAVLDANGSPLNARIMRHRAYVAHRAADAEKNNPEPRS